MPPSVLSIGLFVFIVSLTAAQGQEGMDFDFLEWSEDEGIFVVWCSASSSLLPGLFSQRCLLGGNEYL